MMRSGPIFRQDLSSEFHIDPSGIAIDIGRGFSSLQNAAEFIAAELAVRGHKSDIRIKVGDRLQEANIAVFVGGGMNQDRHFGTSRAKLIQGIMIAVSILKWLS
jgi:hypothetical protein